MKKLLPKLIVTSLVIALLISAGSISYGESFNYKIYTNCTTTNFYKTNNNANTSLYDYLNKVNFNFSDFQKQPQVPNTDTTPSKPKNTTPQDTTTQAPTNTVEQKPQDTTKQATQNNNTNNVSSSVRAMETKVVELVNAERAKNGLNPLTENTELSRVARIKSQDMIDKNYFSHTSPTYGSPFDMMKNFGIKYRTAGENIAAGYSTPESVVNGWMNSEGHRANILSSNFNKIGVGYAVDKNGKAYWTQMFTD